MGQERETRGDEEEEEEEKEGGGRGEEKDGNACLQKKTSQGRTMEREGNNV